MSPQKVLKVWDDGCQQDGIHRALLMVSLGAEDYDLADLMNWSIEKRDTTLFDVRQKLFGNRIIGISECAECREMVEWESHIAQLEIPKPDSVPDNVNLEISSSGQLLSVRLPNSKDLMAVTGSKILENCIVNSHQNGKSKVVDIEEESITTAINKEFERVCVSSNISYRVHCSACENEWEAVFDIASYLWKEIDQWAKEFLQDVFILAKSFGWAESDIIEMSQNRRNHYLRLLAD